METEHRGIVNMGAINKEESTTLTNQKNKLPEPVNSETLKDQNLVDPKILEDIVRQAFLMQESEKISKEFEIQAITYPIETNFEEKIPYGWIYSVAERLGISREFIDKATKNYNLSEEKKEEDLKLIGAKPSVEIKREFYSKIFHIYSKKIENTLKREFPNEKLKIDITLPNKWNTSYFHLSFKWVQEKEKTFLGLFKRKKEITKTKLADIGAYILFGERYGGGDEIRMSAELENPYFVSSCKDILLSFYKELEKVNEKNYLFGDTTFNYPILKK